MRWALVLLLSGCYAPDPPSGGYQCADDGACPSAQTCVCGLCVRSPKDAVCKLAIDAGNATVVAEHQPFPVTITALYDKSDPASVALGYEGSVDLSFELPDGSLWADVSPSTVKLHGGTATAMVSLNRETVPPQSPRLVARFLEQSYSSGAVVVKAPAFVRDATALVPPLGGFMKWGWAQGIVAFPTVRQVGGAYRMYFSGLDGNFALSIGVATSSDGKTYTPTSAPIVSGVAGSNGPPVVQSQELAAPALYTVGDDTVMALSNAPTLNPDSDGITIDRSTSKDGLSGWSPLETVVDCKNGPDFCSSRASFGSVVVDPALVDSDGTAHGWLMFFVGTAKASGIAAIGLASSVDGHSFVVEPSPVLNGDLGGEAALAAPQVVVDGSVYKMWYSFRRVREIFSAGDGCKFSVGYATSTDGRYWVRSPSNTPTAPIEGPSGTGWDGTDIGFFVSSVITSGTGIQLYYTVFRDNGLGGCTPNGIGRATRP